MQSKTTKSTTERSLRRTLLATAKDRLTEKEKQMLRLLITQECNKNMTQTVKSITVALQCPESTAWFSMRRLLSIGMIERDPEYGNISLSIAARIVVEEGI